MPDLQESDLTQAAAIEDGDFFRIVKDVLGTPLSQIADKDVVADWLDTLYEPLGGGGTGWQVVTETWTRTGNHTFTVATDLTARYQKGTKIRYKDTGAFEYGVIGSSSYSAPNTTVNLIPNSDYAMAAGSITETAISYQENPQAWPDWFNWAGTWAGFAPAFSVLRWKVKGNRTIHCTGRTGLGASSTVNTSVTAPIAARTVTNMFWASPCSFTDNSVVSASTGAVSINSADTFIIFYRDWTFTLGGWTNANNRAIRTFSLEYEF